MNFGLRQTVEHEMRKTAREVPVWEHLATVNIQTPGFHKSETAISGCRNHPTDIQELNNPKQQN